MTLNSPVIDVTGMTWGAGFCLLQPVALNSQGWSVGWASRASKNSTFLWQQQLAWCMPYSRNTRKRSVINIPSTGICDYVRMSSEEWVNCNVQSKFIYSLAEPWRVSARCHTRSRNLLSRFPVQTMVESRSIISFLSATTLVRNCGTSASSGQPAALRVWFKNDIVRIVRIVRVWFTTDAESEDGISSSCLFRLVQS